MYEPSPRFIIYAAIACSSFVILITVLMVPLLSTSLTQLQQSFELELDEVKVRQQRRVRVS